MSDPIQDLRDHVDRRFGEVHTSLEGIRSDLGDIREGQLDHANAHAHSATKGQATGIAALVAALVGVLPEILRRLTH